MLYFFQAEKEEQEAREKAQAKEEPQAPYQDQWGAQGDVPALPAAPQDQAGGVKVTDVSLFQVSHSLTENDFSVFKWNSQDFFLL